MLLFINVISIAFLALLLYLMYRSNAYAFLIIAFPSISILWMGFSLVYLETGAYSSQLSVATKATGATVRYAVAIAALFLSHWGCFNLFVNRHRVNARVLTPDTRVDRESLYTAIWLVALGFALVLLYYSPREEITSRNLFMAENPILLRDLAFKYLAMVSLLLGAVAGFTRRSRTRTLVYISIIGFLIILSLYGHKYSALSSFISHFVIAYGAIICSAPMKRYALGLTARKQFVLILFVMCVLLLLGIHNYVGALKAVGVDYFTERLLVQQGEMWWATDYEALYGTHQPGYEGFLDFIQSIDYKRNLALIYLMIRTIGYDLTQTVVFEHFNLYTGAFPTIFYEVGGALGPVALSALSGVCVAVSGAYYMRKLIQRQIVRLSVAYLIFLPVVAVIESGEVTQLFSPVFASKVGVAFLLEIAYATVVKAKRLPTGMVASQFPV